MLRVGILGCGSIAWQRHAYEYTHNPDAELVGCFDLNEKRAAALAKQFRCKVYRTAEELIDDPGIDAVSVCVANAYHASMTLEALTHGKHVLCEKPMAVTLADCQEMAATAKQYGKRLLIGHNQRLAPAHRKAKEILESGALGSVISFSSTFGHKGPELWSMDKSANTWFFHKSTAAFGSMADLGIHKIDLVRYLLGSPVKSVYSNLSVLDKKFPDGTPIEVDDNSVEVLTFEGGAVGTVTTSWTHYGEECNATVLYCKNGIMKLYFNPQYSVEIVWADGTRTLYELDRLQTNDDAQQAPSGVIDEFVKSVLSGKPSVLDAEDILQSMRVVFACLRSAQEGGAVEL